MMVSVDDHVTEPPTIFDRWLPKKYKDRAPHVETRMIDEDSRLFDGLVEKEGGLPGSVWVFGNSAYVIRRPITVLKDVATSAAVRGNEPVTYDIMHPACYDPKERLK